MSNSMHKIVLNASNYEDLLTIPFVRECLILAHIMNTLRSSQRFLVSTEGYPDTPIKIRDARFGLLTTISFVYGGLERANGILKDLATSIPSMRNEISWVLNQYSDPSSLFNTTLKKIRDQMVFHFGIQISDDVLKTAINRYPPLFAEGTSDAIADWTYTLADNVIVRLLTIYDTASGTPEEKIENLVKQLSDYTERFCDILDHVISELISESSTGYFGDTNNDQ